MDLQFQLQAVVTEQEVDRKGCFCHLTQSTWRRMQHLGLVQQYSSDDEFRHFCGMLEGLGLLPRDEVPEGMEYLKKIAQPEAAELMTYFDKAYVTGTYRMLQADVNNHVHVRMRRTLPLYTPNIWNVHEATVSDPPRTNNFCAG